jgi:hypothetical protein
MLMNFIHFCLGAVYTAAAIIGTHLLSRVL